MGKNSLLRIYPIRTTRKKWVIKLYHIHKCTDDCNIRISYSDDDPDQIVVSYNPLYVNGKCERYKIIERTCVYISQFNMFEDYIKDGNFLYKGDEIVVPDTTIFVILSFPLSYIYETRISTQNSNGFTLKYIINYIKLLYQFIYEEEERTSSPQTYNIKKQCTDCNEKDITKHSEIYNKQDNDSECTICVSNYDEDTLKCKLNCSHEFHHDCIESWVKTSGTCPICRHNIFNCKSCDGSGIIKYSFTGTVIPFNERGLNTLRNPTNGVFGIYNHDFEDLVLESMKYDSSTKRLHINIIS